ncbi:MAG: PH domain-containing protein [Acidimicrobiales bacterium]
MRARRRKAAEVPVAKGASTERSLRGRLFDDEDLLMLTRPGRMASFPKYVATLGLYGFWRKRDTSAVTDQRVLLAHGIVRRDERSIPLSNVDDVSVARRGLYSHVDLTITQRGSRVTQRVGPLSPGAARRFAREILRQL